MWISKDSLGAAIWAFWMSLVGTFVIWVILMGLNFTAIAVEIDAPVRIAKVMQRAADARSDFTEESQASNVNRLVEATRRSWHMGGGFMLLLFGVASLWLWVEKRPTKIVDPKVEFVDKRAKDRNVI